MYFSKKRFRSFILHDFVSDCAKAKKIITSTLHKVHIDNMKEYIARKQARVSGNAAQQTKVSKDLKTLESSGDKHSTDIKKLKLDCVELSPNS